MRHLVVFASLFLLSACGGDSNGPSGSAEPDAGDTSSGESDAGTDDAGAADAGTDDTGSDDSGSTDTGDVDAGTEDAGPEDVGSDDTSAEDASDDDVAVVDTGEDATEDAGDDTGAEDVGTDDSGTDDAGADADDSSADDVAPDVPPEPTFGIEAGSAEVEAIVGETIVLDFRVTSDTGEFVGVPVRFAVDGGASLSTDTVESVADGRVTVEVTLDTVPGTSVVTAMLEDGASAEIAIERVAGPAASLVAESTSIVVPGSATLMISVTDEYDNPVPAAPLMVSGIEGVGVMEFDTAEMTTDEAGIALLGVIVTELLDGVPFGEPVAIASVGVPDAMIDVELTFVDPATLVVNDDLPDHFVVVGGVPADVLVTVTDESGTPVSGVDVELAVESADWAGSTGVTDAFGEARLTLTGPSVSEDETGFAVGITGEDIDLSSRFAMAWTYSLEELGFTWTFESDLADSVSMVSRDVLFIDTEHEFSDGFERVHDWTIDLTSGEVTHWFGREESDRVRFQRFVGDGTRVLIGLVADGDESAESFILDLDTGLQTAVYEPGYVLTYFDEHESGVTYVAFEDVDEPGDEPFEIFRIDLETGFIEPVATLGNRPRSVAECASVLYIEEFIGRYNNLYAFHGDVEETWTTEDIRLYQRYSTDGRCQAFVRDSSEDGSLYLLDPVEGGFERSFIMTDHNANHILAADDLSFVVVDSWDDEITRRVDIGEDIVVTELSGPVDSSYSSGMFLAARQTIVLQFQNYRRAEREVFSLPVDGSGPAMPAVVSLDVPIESTTRYVDGDLSADGRWLAVLQSRTEELLDGGLDSHTIVGAWVRDLETDESELELIDNFGALERFYEADDTGFRWSIFDPTSRWLALAGDPFADGDYGIWIYDMATGSLRRAISGLSDEPFPNWADVEGMMEVTSGGSYRFIDIEALMSALD